MAEPKEKTDAEKHEDFEKQQAKDGVAIHLPRGPVNPATGKVDAPVQRKSNPSK